MMTNARSIAPEAHGTRSNTKPVLSHFFQAVRFGIAGAAATAVHLGILLLLTEWGGVWYLTSAGVGFCAGFVVSFSLQKWWTFRERTMERIPGQVARFGAVAVSGLAINTTGLYVLAEVAGLWYLAAQVLMIGVVACISFFLYRTMVFAVPSAAPHR